MEHDYEKLTEKARELSGEWRNQESRRIDHNARVKITRDNLMVLEKRSERFERRIHVLKIVFAQMEKPEARAIMDIMETPHIQEKSRAFRNGMELEQYQKFIAQAWRNFGHLLEKVEGWEEL